MKKLTKAILLIILITVVASATVLTVGAHELCCLNGTSLTDNARYGEISDTGMGIPDISAEDKECAENNSPPLDTESCDADEVSESESNESVFAVIYKAVSEYSGEIMSALSLIGSLIIAFAYKRGLTPMLNGALGGMLNSVSALKESVSLGEKKVDEMSEALSARIEASERSISALSELIPDLSELAESARREKALHTELETLLSEQVNMLYDIFMASGLPQYRKDAVGERISAMRRALDAEGTKSGS